MISRGGSVPDSDPSLQSGCRPLGEHRFAKSGFGARRVATDAIATDATLSPGRRAGNFPRMSTLAEIEKAADALSASQKQELLMFLVARLRADGAGLPEPRRFSRDQVEAWIAEDEGDLRRFQQGA